MLFLLILIGVPIVEVLAFIEVGHAIGWLAAIVLLLATSVLGVRLVRVDLYAFGEDLEALKIPHDRYPGFFLLALDLQPRDGIDGGEWGDDIAPNIAPVLGAFVRGKFTQRKEPWKPVAGSGMSL